MGRCFSDSSTKASICFDCEKACGGCSWSEFDEATGQIRFEVPEGAYAIPVYKANGELDTYQIRACPLFERTPDRKTGGTKLDDKEEEQFFKDPIAFIEAYIRRNGGGVLRNKPLTIAAKRNGGRNASVSFFIPSDMGMSHHAKMCSSHHGQRYTCSIATWEYSHPS